MRQHPLFSEVTGGGPVDIEVRLVDPGYVFHWDALELQIIARVHGGDFYPLEPRGHLSTWRVDCTTDATDAEHDRSHFIRLDVVSPTVVAGASGTELVYLGTLASAVMWPTGTDPAVQSDADTSAGRCDGWPGQPGEHAPHPLAAFMPPKRAEVDALLPLFVTVTVIPAGQRSVTSGTGEES